MDSTPIAVTTPDDFGRCDLARVSTAQGWQAQYKLIIEWGRAVSPKPWLRTDVALIGGCEVPAWLARRVIDGRVYYDFDCDSRVISGFATLLLAPLQGQAPTPLSLNAVTAPLVSLDLGRHLTPTRNNGLAHIAQRLVDLSAS